MVADRFCDFTNKVQRYRIGVFIHPSLTHVEDSLDHLRSSGAVIIDTATRGRLCRVPKLTRARSVAVGPVFHGLESGFRRTRFP